MLLASFKKIANAFYNFLIAVFFEEYNEYDKKVNEIKGLVKFNISKIEQIILIY